MNYYRGRPQGTMRSTIERGDPRKFAAAYTLFYWHRPEYGITISSGVKISAWADQWVNGIDMLQGTDSLRPTLSLTAINGHPGIVFDSVDDLLDSATFSAITQPCTLFVVLKFAAGGTAQIFIDAPSGNRNAFYRSDASTMGLFAGSVFSPTYATDTDQHVFTAVFNGASSRAAVDGTSIGTGSVGAQGTAQIRYGGQLGGGNPFSGAMGESMRFQSVVPADVAARIEKRLKALAGVAA